ncbi:MAG: hypothetical protein EA376_11725 [Phycisphaeraceae bacterium]|nr:MAG: hypothetical protein EA376_11725 [Phycisphaeraceae bacterium]
MSSTARHTHSPSSTIAANHTSANMRALAFGSITPNPAASSGISSSSTHPFAMRMRRRLAGSVCCSVYEM